MKSRMMIVSVLAIGCAANVALSQQGVGVQLKDRDRLQTFSATLQKDQTRLQECLPTELKTSIKDMTLARDQAQLQLRDKQKDVAVCTVETRDVLRDQIKDQLKDQTKDCDQIRDRLQDLRQSLPTHTELMDQSREQTKTESGQTRRGE